MKVGDFLITHSKKLEETKLWKVYNAKNLSNSNRFNWVKKVYEAATKYLLDVRLSFKNYTLHDETHILNVIDAMGGLLGNQTEYLTTNELELLILASCLHDLGMVYTDKEKQQWFEDKQAYNMFSKKNCIELIGIAPKDWPEDKQQWYLRTLHPFRLSEVLQNDLWVELFDCCPLEIVPKRYILAVCQAHGENPQAIRNNNNLEYLPANNACPLFCSLLLRLCDLLDFDDTRTPKVLYDHVAYNEKSREEWDKHRASAGFSYPTSPSANPLPYKARCTNPHIEHVVRNFLDWIDDELSNCIKLQKYCGTEWQRDFPFPRKISRNEIESDGYMSGDFCLTMNQTQTLKLLSGKNLYDNIDIFIRELLQNAIDATLLRNKIDSHFIPEESRIDLWEWIDKNGNLWFRIDDQGIGMTLGMLQRYFLKVGSSYYTSPEMERDLTNYGQTTEYHGISQFGIGFLSTFLCGDYAEISTLYCISEKNLTETPQNFSHHMVRYGLRLQMTGLTGYYTLKNQSKQHPADLMPAPECYNTTILHSLERNGYRAKPGTSIAIRLNPGKLGTLNLQKTAEKYLCASKMPIYYNNERIGQTHKEFTQTIHKLAKRKNIYELTPEIKKHFNLFFPVIHGHYPKIVITVIPLDRKETQIFPDLSGVIVNLNVCFDNKPQWEIKDQIYTINSHIHEKNGDLRLVLESTNTDTFSREYWELLMKNFDPEKVIALEKEFEKHTICPQKDELLGKAWLPFKEHLNLQLAWKTYINHQHEKRLEFSLIECIPKILKDLPFIKEFGKITFVYQGVVAGNIDRISSSIKCTIPLILLENKWRPTIDISRTRITNLPLPILIATYGYIIKYTTFNFSEKHHSQLLWKKLDGENTNSLREWRKSRSNQLDEWMKKNLKKFFQERKQQLHKSEMISGVQYYNTLCHYYDHNHEIFHEILYEYLMADLQDNYHMTINYEKGQVISFYKKKISEKEAKFDIFPPMMFCKAASKQSRKYICAADASFRKCITLDHPFVMWLLENSMKLAQHYPRQFQQIINCLCLDNAKNIIEKCNHIREQLISFPKHYSIAMHSFPKLSSDDFWVIKKPYEDHDICL